MSYLVWSNEHNAWWRGNRCGYTQHMDKAGRYTRKEAIQICAMSRDGWGGNGPLSEVPVSEADALECVETFNRAFAK